MTISIAESAHVDPRGLFFFNAGERERDLPTLGYTNHYLTLPALGVPDKIYLKNHTDEKNFS